MASKEYCRHCLKILLSQEEGDLLGTKISNIRQGAAEMLSWNVAQFAPRIGLGV